MGLLDEDDSHQADGRSLLHGGGYRCLAYRLCSPRDEINAKFRCRSGEFDRLGEVKQSTGAQEHWVVFQAFIKAPAINQPLREVIGGRFQKLLPILERVGAKSEGVSLAGGVIEAAVRRDSAPRFTREASRMPRPERSAKISQDVSLSPS
jgi:hypothetical protein